MKKLCSKIVLTDWNLFAYNRAAIRFLLRTITHSIICKGKLVFLHWVVLWIWEEKLLNIKYLKRERATINGLQLKLKSTQERKGIPNPALWDFTIWRGKILYQKNYPVNMTGFICLNPSLQKNLNESIIQVQDDCCRYIKHEPQQWFLQILLVSMKPC